MVIGMAVLGAFLLGMLVGSHVFPTIPEGWYYSSSRRDDWDDEDIDKMFPPGSEYRVADLSGKDN